MKVIVVGATGTIGQAVVQALSGRHEVVAASHSRAGHKVDIADSGSIEQMLAAVGPFDALISTAGRAAFRSLEELTDADFQLSLGNKLMGQVNLVRIGLRHIREGGSFTLTSGVLAREPMTGSGAISLVNSALEGFARAAAFEKPRGVRVNVVSPPWVAETLQAMGRDPSDGMPAAEVAKAYVHCLEGTGTGEVVDARDFRGRAA